MRYLIFVLILGLFAVTGCNKEDGIFNAATVEEEVDLRTADRPFKATGSALDALPAGVLQCTSPEFERSVTGGGNATHIGNYDVAIHECFDPTTFVGTGVAILTAANGDILYQHYQAQYYQLPGDPPNVVHGVFNYWYWDGDLSTGRFEGVTGSGTGTLEGDLQAGYYEWIAYGTINY